MQKLSGTILEKSFLEYQKNIEIKLNEFKQSVGEEVLKPYLDSILTSDNYNAFSSILNETRERIKNDKRLTNTFKNKNVFLLTNAINEIKSITNPTKSKNNPTFVVRHIGGEHQYYHNINKDLNISDLLNNDKYYVNQNNGEVWDFKSGKQLQKLKYDKNTGNIIKIRNNKVIENFISIDHPEQRPEKHTEQPTEQQQPTEQHTDKYSYLGCLGNKSLKGVAAAHLIFGNPSIDSVTGPIAITLSISVTGGAYSIAAGVVCLLYNAYYCMGENSEYRIYK